mmetsp:Transcript_9033/g.13575  ORF Transcript_9033/g.13575 Transcript_9033/m.13575 type:complete len:154 (+) Transcript_9033:142-603(+)|eukprot:CAMPEP_0185032194 /NCGR_PEP_ID=MMETSP1103-20130426/20107_1 /TAXON_ID=36769 /ORGANISM="Paraphysomonas bandaiensis, Strain Caron Lab Isolate" /LENGTH=153 /DNA_ID=CAMNT_0027567997 /DNA_START=112 /DNA_END=573 /DNA_ORIENTATION=+
MSNKRITEIEQQMAHLAWLKAQNERAYRNTMEKTRVMHQNDIILKMSVDNNSEKASWMASVIKDELSRPLVLTDAEMHAMKMKSERESKMLANRTTNHLRSVKRIQKDIKRRIDVNDNTKEYLEEPLQHFSLIESSIQENMKKTRKAKGSLKR